MEENRLPSLFEILNRFSKPPVDLWAFYVYLNEQYGGVEYLEFWLDCSAHTALCKELAKELLRTKRNSNSTGNNSNEVRETGGNPRDPRDEDIVRNSHRGTISGVSGANHEEIPSTHSPSSSVLFDLLRDESSSERQRNSHHSHDSSNEERDLFDATGTLPSGRKRFSTLSDERAKNKRDTVSRLSEILDNMQMPVYPSTAATSPTRNLRGSQGFDHGIVNTEEDSRITEEPQSPRRGKRSSDNLIENLTEATDVEGNHSARIPPSTPPPRIALTSNVSPTHRSENPYIDTQGRNRDSVNERSAFGARGPGGAISATAASRLAVRESALRIIGTYLTPKAPKEIELPTDNQGWSMAEEIRQLVFIPGGLENPRVFEGATTYVFEALEREALPGFLVSRALSNVQPVSASIRLVGGLIALFGAFWLSFVYILLDWTPKSHRCWVILPFGFGWYLTITALYHIDPVLAFSGLGERDGGGLIKLQEKFVMRILAKRSLFVIFSVLLLTAAFCVLFILVPGHRL